MSKKNQWYEFYNSVPGNHMKLLVKREVKPLGTSVLKEKSGKNLTKKKRT